MIVITGATGQVGSKIATRLLSEGKQVKALGRNQEKLYELKRQGAFVEKIEPSDTAGLTNAFKNADAVFLILPPNLQAEDIGKYQDKVGEGQIEAIQKANIKNVVFLSSQGAGDFEKTGVVAMVGRHEKRLNNLPDDVNVLSIRPTYFMENMLSLIPMIDQSGIIGTPIKSNVRLGLIATTDIAEFAAEKLSNLDFKSKSHVDLLGNRHYDHIELAAIIGNAIGKPELPYIEFTYADNKAALLKYGISESAADYFNTLYRGINEGIFSSTERTAASTTPTSFEFFISMALKPEQQAKA